MNKRDYKINPQQTVLVIGGRGFIGGHIVRHLERLGARVIVGTRKPKLGSKQRQIELHRIANAKQWEALLVGIDVVVNAVGILRQRPNETYEQVHHRAVSSLATACANMHLRLVHISALGLRESAQSRFILSKLRGEQALKNCATNWAIVRPSLVDGDGGFGAKWFRRVAQWPVHFSPANANGLFAPVHVDDLGEAVAKIALKVIPETTNRIYELGGKHVVGLTEYLQRLKLSVNKSLVIKVPAWLSRVSSHLLDCVHLTPYSFGHYELLKHNNCPEINRLMSVLGRPAKTVGRAKSSDPQLNLTRRQVTTVKARLSDQISILRDNFISILQGGV